MIEIIESPARKKEKKIMKCKACETTFSYQKEDLFTVEIPNVVIFQGVKCPYCKRNVMDAAYVNKTEWEGLFSVSTSDTTFTLKAWNILTKNM